MEWEDRTIFFKFLVDSFSYKNLNTYQSDDEGSSDEEENEAELIQKKINNIKISTEEPEVIGFRKILITTDDGYRHPIMISLVAMNDIPLGVKIYKYNIQETDIEQIAMLVIHPRKNPFNPSYSIFSPLLRRLEKNHRSTNPNSEEHPSKGGCERVLPYSILLKLRGVGLSRGQHISAAHRNRPEGELLRILLCGQL